VRWSARPTRSTGATGYQTVRIAPTPRVAQGRARPRRPPSFAGDHAATGRSETPILSRRSRRARRLRQRPSCHLGRRTFAGHAIARQQGLRIAKAATGARTAGTRGDRGRQRGRLGGKSKRGQPRNEQPSEDERRQSSRDGTHSRHSAWGCTVERLRKNMASGRHAVNALLPLHRGRAATCWRRHNVWLCCGRSNRLRRQGRRQLGPGHQAAALPTLPAHGQDLASLSLTPWSYAARRSKSIGER